MDAIGQTNSIAYGSTNISSPAFYQIASVTDPFSRSAYLLYDVNGYLTNITDVIRILIRSSRRATRGS